MNEKDLEKIVAEVTRQLTGNKVAHKASLVFPKINLGKGVFDNMEEAIEAAKKTEEELKVMPLEFRDKIIARIREKIMENKELLAEFAVHETGMGKVGHKILKHELVAKKTPGTECIEPKVWTGDQGLTLVERGPFGVVGAITPSTNPSETVFCNAIGMIAAGNTVVFNSHPNAAQTSNLAVQLVNEAAEEAGGLTNVVTTVMKPTAESGNILFKHPDIQLLVATGGPGVVKAILQSGKRGIAAGAGNPPVLVDETANIRKAAADIINGATFDNNLPCIAEKEVIVVNEVADELLYYMQAENDCYKLVGEQIEKLVQTVLVEKNGKKIINRDFVGRDATVILKAIGIDAPENTRCIIFEADENHILVVEELMMPILGIVRVANVDEGIAIAHKLEGGNRHSAHMHSSNVHNLTKYGKVLDTAIYVKNAPSYAGIGFGGEGYTTFTIASKTGEGLTNAQSFTKARRCVMAEALYIR
ncbi:aldehyde dehydrogenase EutE [Sporanaerobium hydrogeniformans]|uniref:Aldehyde dehydrogenase EutE n=1 Tax=Sporanaerobium hydrogeniformans TaxID=3072179 RepID=A0AC61DGT5_9FIRM|nr:aldehyde dehydrogenase family protein [Sporanaerobium hydrogeniformans]PHV72117.1 aldehyde dehydrogenase EutE [Sporanaerobium hydrogeniformans]